MWRTRAVFVPKSPEGSRVAFSQKLLKASARVRACMQVVLEPISAGGHGRGVRIECGVRLLGPRARLIFRRGTEREPERHASPVLADSALLPSTPDLAIPERRFHLAEGSRPYAWLSFRSALHQPLQRSICLGRIDRVPIRGEAAFEVPALVNAWLSVRDLSRHRGPILNLTGELAFPEGVEMVVRLAASCDRFGEPAENPELAVIPVLPAGVAVTVPPQVVDSGVSEAPWVSFLLHDWAGGVTEREVLVGRCVRLH